MGVLIDTCVWIDTEQGSLAPADIIAIIGTEPVYLSPITIAELKFGAECVKSVNTPATAVCFGQNTHKAGAAD